MTFVRARTVARHVSRQIDKKRDLRNFRYVGPHGINHALVVTDEICQTVQIIPNGGQATFSPGLSVIAGTAGGGRSRAILNKPGSGAGTSVPLTSDTTAKVIAIPAPEYYAVVTDPSVSTTVHVHRYNLAGAFLGLKVTVNLAALTGSTPSLATAAPVKDIEAVADGFAVLDSAGGNLQLVLINTETGAATETTLLDATGNITSGSLYVDSAGPFIYAGGVLDINAAPDEIKLFRTTLPNLTDTQEVGLRLKTGAGSASFPGVVLPDRWRVGQQSGGSWTTIDHIFLDPAASPQDGSEVADLHDNPNFNAFARLWPLGHDGVNTGWFAFDDFNDVRIWKVGTTGAGSAAGFTDGEYQDDGMTVIASGPVTNRWWTFLGVFKPPDQASTTGPPRVSSVQFLGEGISLPLPIELDIAAAELFHGWSAGEAFPGGVFRWFS